MISLDRVTYTYPFQTRAAIMDIRLQVAPGEAVLVTGASGCGKSTLIRLANGLCPHFFKGRLEGCVRINGKDNADRRISDIAADIGTLFQDPEHQFFALTVADEIAFAHEWRETSPEGVQRKVCGAAAQFGLGPILSQSVQTLSEGQKQKLALAGVMSLNPRALVLDEPTGNLDPESTLELARTIRGLKESGMAVIVADHRLYWLESVVDRVVVMSEGRIVAEGGFDMLAGRDMGERFGLRRMRVADTRTRLKPIENGNGKIRVADLRFGYDRHPDLFAGESFSLPTGITALIGRNGAGKTTLARLLTGLVRMRSGRLFIGKEAVSPGELRRRTGIVMQNTDHQLHMRTVAEEVSLAAASGRIRRGAPADETMLHKLGLTQASKRHPQSLSGGEKQRLLIACAMARRPEILILDEPTSGLDGRNMRVIADCLRMAARSGTCVLLITHVLELLDLACDYALRIPIQTTATQDKHHV